MRATLNGTVLEKFLKHSKQPNEEPKTMIRLYQKGEKINTDVNVLKDTYEEAKEGKPYTVECSIGSYSFNGQSGMFAKEVDRF